MKKTLLGLFAACCLFAFAAPARAEGDAPAGDKPADAKKEKKSKKAKKGDKDAAAGDAAGAPPAEKK